MRPTFLAVFLSLVTAMNSSEIDSASPSQLSSFYLNTLKNLKGHWDQASPNPTVDNFNGDKHRVMNKLASFISIGDPIAKVFELFGKPDETRQSDPASDNIEPIPIMPGIQMAPDAVGAPTPELYLLYRMIILMQIGEIFMIISTSRSSLSKSAKLNGIMHTNDIAYEQALLYFLLFFFDFSAAASLTCCFNTFLTIFCSSIKNARTILFRTHNPQRDPP